MNLLTRNCTASHLHKHTHTHKKEIHCIGHHFKSHLYIFCSLHSYILAEPDLYLFWFISQRWLPKRAQQNRVITIVPLVSLIPQAIRICRTLFSTQKKLYRVVIDSESSAGTHGLNPLDHLIMFNKRQSLPLWFIALSKPVTNPGTAQVKAKWSSHWYACTQIGPHTRTQKGHLKSIYATVQNFGVKTFFFFFYIYLYSAMIH